MPGIPPGGARALPSGEAPTMSDMPKDAGTEPVKVDEPLEGFAKLDEDADIGTSFVEGEEHDVLSLVEEKLAVSTRRRSTGIVRVGTRVEAVEALAEVELDRYRVEVTRVPVGRVVAEPPAAWVEGDTTVIPVVEERLVVVKQFVLVEEVRIRHVLDREAVSEPVTLRRQRAVVERLDRDHVTHPDETTSEAEAARGAEGGRHGSVG